MFWLGLTLGAGVGAGGMYLWICWCFRNMMQ